MTGTTSHHITACNLADLRSYALGGDPYTILFHIGEVPEIEISARTTAPTQHLRFVGSVYNFSTPLIGTDGQRVCENCDEQAAAGSLSSAQIPLTKTMYDYAADKSILELSHTDPDRVEEYLKEHLHWVVTTVSTPLAPMLRSNDVARPMDRSFPSKSFQRQRSSCLKERHSIFTRRTNLRCFETMKQWRVLRRVSPVALQTMNTSSKCGICYVHFVVSVDLVALYVYELSITVTIS